MAASIEFDAQMRDPIARLIELSPDATEPSNAVLSWYQRLAGSEDRWSLCQFVTTSLASARNHITALGNDTSIEVAIVELYVRPLRQDDAPRDYPSSPYGLAVRPLPNGALVRFHFD